jgi:hypothetical protein
MSHQRSVMLRLARIRFDLLPQPAAEVTQLFHLTAIQFDRM